MPEVVTPAHATRRPHIQGLRAIAVLLVVAGHAFEVPVGGFLGVDVFFVVSGFVITLSLLREAERDGVVSLRAFVVRRLGRLFPAGALVVTVTVVVSAVVFFLPRATQIAMDGLASVLSVENWRAARLGTDYFAGFAQASPLQHYWSLSVEEQFYAVWPLTFALCALAGWPRLRRWAGVIAATATIASLAIALVESAERPAWAYFSFESRAWELGIGVTLAILLFRVRVRPALSTALAIIGAIVVAASVLLVDGRMGFPAPAALPVVLGTAALIAAGETANPARVLAPLRLRPLTFIGDISYSLYLWHFPLLIIATALWPGAVGIWVSLALLGPFAYATYRFVEVPFRDRAGRVADRGSRGLHFGWGIATLGIVGALSLTQIAGPSSWIETPELTSDATAHPPFETQQQLDDAIDRALLQPEAPSEALDTAWASVSAAQFAARRACLTKPADVIAATDAASLTCVFEGSPDSPTLVVIGDSIAASWLPGIVAAADDSWRVVSLTVQSCPPFVVTVADRTGRAEFGAECDAARHEAFDIAVALDPQLIVLSGALGSYERLSEEHGREAASALWRQGVQESADDLTARTGARLAILSSPPETTPVMSCATRLTGTGSCERAPGDVWEEKTAAEAAAIDGARVTFIDTVDWFCREGTCPAVVDETLVLADGGHLTTAYSMRLSTLLDDALGLSSAIEREGE
ncbi:acyltransferase family protein [Microbacterium sp. SLBN-146]|uniref:acyltransferase family protein n=1 Tax=Microbacterium sp. SLBN-146 TaxID=2768457 RepID=UPI00114EB020|nr:acyltransferase family protein [Microbacterium sp. SLBN-146]TQJ30869.1 peptidoglycan/LPS O-acetylase OafA/YrhL [Microbacterium sp. SLBN-146]